MTVGYYNFIEIIDGIPVLANAGEEAIETSSSYLLDTTFNSDSGWTDLDLSGIAPPRAKGVKLYVTVNESGSVGDVNSKFRLRKDSTKTAESEIRTIYPQATGRTMVGTFEIELDSDKHIEYRAQPHTVLTVNISLDGWA